MSRTIRWLSRILTATVVGGLLLSAVPGASAGQVRRRVIIVQPFAPLYPWGYPWGYYPYAPYYAANDGQVKIDTHRKDLTVYIDGGYAAQINKDKKFALRPGNHDIELRNSEGQTVYQQKVAVMVGKTTKLQVS